MGHQERPYLCPLPIVLPMGLDGVDVLTMDCFVSLLSEAEARLILLAAVVV